MTYVPFPVVDARQRVPTIEFLHSSPPTEGILEGGGNIR